MVEIILRATARILVRDGYDRASTNRIAEAAGVSVGSLYQYFPNKEALVAALVEQHMAEMGELLRADMLQLADAPLAQLVEHMVQRMVDAHAIDPKLHKVLVEQVPRIGNLKRLEAVQDDMTELARLFLSRRKSELAVDDLDLAAFVVVTMVESLTHVAVTARPELLGKPFVKQVTRAVLRYLT